jgi:hypothetical protein
MNVFIDTNIYLSFFHFSNDDLEELRKLVVAINKNKIRLYLPHQVLDEFNRNREVKIADALKMFESQKLPLQYPQMFKGYKEFNLLRSAQDEYIDYRKQLLEHLYLDIKEKKLGADGLINKLFTKANYIPLTEDVFNKAKIRFERGMPPGKNSSYGDAIIWESLLTNTEDKEDIHFIGRDKDYVSMIDPKLFSSYLINEWESKKHSSLYFYTNLTEFFKTHFPEIKLAIDMQRGFAIKDLENSNYFSATHSAISNLSGFTDYTDDEIKKIIAISITNNQVYGISEDEDIRLFLIKLITKKENLLDPETMRQFTKYYINSLNEEYSESPSIEPPF